MCLTLRATRQIVPDNLISEIIAFLGSPKSQKVYRYFSEGNVDGQAEGELVPKQQSLKQPSS